MITTVAFLLICLGGFLIGLYFSGTSSKPVYAPVGVIIRIRKTRYHIHHWMISLFCIVSLLAIVAFTRLSFAQSTVKFVAAFFSGYGAQGLFVKDAFRIKDCGCSRCGGKYYQRPVSLPFLKRRRVAFFR